MNSKPNEAINRLIDRSRLKRWEVAEQIGVTASTFSCWMRSELNEDRKKRVLDAIKALLNEQKELAEQLEL